MLKSYGELRLETAQFAMERDWQQFHTPKNLTMALAGEVGAASRRVVYFGEFLDVGVHVRRPRVRA